VLDGGSDLQAERQFSGVARTIQKHWQSSLQRLLQRRCGVRCKRDDSIANNVMQQKGSISTPSKHK